MKITQQIMNYDEGRGVSVILDDEALTIELAGSKKHDFKERCASLAAMDKAYKKRVAPYLKGHHCYDVDLKQDVEIIKDLEAYFREQVAVGGGDDDEDGFERDLDEEVEATVGLLRKQLNKALGKKAIVLDVAVFWFAEESIALDGVVLNPKHLTSSMTDAELVRGLTAIKSTELVAAKLDLEMNPLGGESLRPYGDPYNYYDHCIAQLLHLALVRLQASPGLRSNATPAKRCRILMNGIDLELLAAAREHVKKPAETFFDATSAKPRTKARGKPIAKADKQALWKAIEKADRKAAAAALDRDPRLASCLIEGMTPLDWACGEGASEIVHLLLAAGADPDQPRPGFHGIGPLHIAAEHGSLECVRALLAAGAKVDLENPVGTTPLMEAAHAGMLAVVQALLDAGADARKQNSSGDGVLRYTLDAAYTDEGKRDKPAVMCLLLAAGADLAAKNSYGETALDLAEKRHVHELAEILAAASGRKCKLGPLAACETCSARRKR